VEHDFLRHKLEPSFLRTTPAKNPRTECGCQPVEAMMPAMVAPLGRRSRPSTRACFEFARVRWRPIIVWGAAFVRLARLTATGAFQ
jgi:hypothetical protein